MAYSRQYKSSVSAIKQISKLSSGRVSTWDKYNAIKLATKQTKTLNQSQSDWLVDYRKRKEIANDVAMILENDNTSPRISTRNPVRPANTRDTGKNADNQAKRWRMCLQAISIGARAGYAYGNLYYRDKASTDNIQMKQTKFRTLESTMAVGLSLVPVLGPALASTFSFATQVVSRNISNSIQRRGDRGRVAYNFANYDLGKYGTYAYDNTANEWVSQDANKVATKVLGRKTTA